MSGRYPNGVQPWWEAQPPCHIEGISTTPHGRTENDNFYYGLTPANKADLSHIIFILTGTEPHAVMDLLAEIDADTQLLDHLNGTLSALPGTRDVEVALGRRIG